MFVLGIETSCDETSAAVVKDGKRVFSNIVASSLKFHQKYGGIIPEIAFRAQLETITCVVDNALSAARLKPKDIKLISMTRGPGLLGSLLVGISFAKAAGLSLDVPFLGVNHLEGHIYASFLNRDKSIQLPFVGLVVSGGHTSLFYVKDFDNIKILGSTLDDACGETFDKVAKILGLGYPGGPVIEKLAKEGNLKKIKLSCCGTKNPLDFSFSGIKTAVLYLTRNYEPKTKKQRADIAASFQETVIEALIRKSFLACKIKGTKRLVIGGGVVANNYLREKFREEALKNKLNLYYPCKEFCMDNAAMIAGLGYRLFRKGYRSGLDLSVELN